MKITDLPFNRHLELAPSDDAALGDWMLADAPRYTNHVGTVHAAALYALAEACCGDFLMTFFGGDVTEAQLPLLRRAETRYRRPASGAVYGRAEVAEEARTRLPEELDARGRALLQIDVTVRDAGGAAVMTGRFEWFVQRR